MWPIILSRDKVTWPGHRLRTVCRIWWVPDLGRSRPLGLDDEWWFWLLGGDVYVGDVYDGMLGEFLCIWYGERMVGCLPRNLKIYLPQGDGNRDWFFFFEELTEGGSRLANVIYIYFVCEYPVNSDPVITPNKAVK